MSNITHDASGQLIGYLYQLYMALLLLLEEVNPNSKLCIEKFDDVSFGEDDIPSTLVQTKHQINRIGTLTNTSTDLWRTINSWCDYISSTSADVENTKFVIVTTAKSTLDSIPYYLTDNPSRNTQQALADLITIATTNTSKTNLSYYKRFSDLDDKTKEKFVSNMHIHDSSVNITGIEKKILKYVKYATLPQYQSKVYDKLIGWWINLMIKGLCSDTPVFIHQSMLQQQIFDIGSEYKADSLPIDIDIYYEPTAEDLSALPEQDRIFIEQLKLISVSNDRLKLCIRDYYNAYMQRSRWVRESLLYLDDLSKYENLLVDEWKRLFLIMKEDLEDYGDSITETDKTRAGRQLLKTVEDLNKPIRPQVNQAFIMRGTYHALSNKLKVGWNLDFYERLCHLLKES
ncbi:ABC-three component system protein [Fusibacter ferrireducens]|uniref:ABC-three component systems C-terminal domain-containing protein n=1 Tax=Fusibacter ferrireducens TaxID=2785058 RepID=A0ABR9ZVP5_9FIRM|nr:ABC-three component system protein [Fusibacter ferrireducens]MBF4693975.1 hypothetical protein [Fusibacter ferrireducens]